MAAKKEISKDKVQSAFRKLYRMVQHRSNLAGVDIGYAWSKDEQTSEHSVRVHLTQKLPLEAVPKHEVIPKVIDGVRVDVLEGAYRIPEIGEAQPQTRKAVRVLMGGVSVSNAKGGAGTLGAIVKDRETGQPGLLSNWHVLASAGAQDGTTVFHPALMDATTAPPLPVAQLTRSVLGFAGDAAFATLTQAAPWVPLQYGTFRPITSVRRSKLGETLIKSGRTTGTTKAKVDGEGIYRLHYEIRPGVFEPRDIEGFRLVARRDENPTNEEISAAGDSGAGWIHERSGAGVGLHFAGETSPLAEHEFALACNLDSVLDALDLDLASFEDAFAPNLEAAGTEYTPNPVNPLPPTWPPFGPGPGWPWGPPRPPRWPPFPPRPPFPPIPPRPPWGPYANRRVGGFGAAPQDALGGQFESAADYDIDALFLIMKEALRKEGYFVDNLTLINEMSDLVISNGDPYGMVETAIAGSMNTHAPFALRRPITGRDLFRNGDGYFSGACTVIQFINKGLIP
ncbi:hypothetical protein [uncultured Roseobacter sp.]|uniref:hypothetical protein n=1 Tax=uncultured Roseobacter sp. TaxID=114847 RepID=UPI0026105221|nr:hypothetical protein [uncultured Roseobacter sp.]